MNLTDTVPKFPTTGVRIPQIVRLVPTAGSMLRADEQGPYMRYADYHEIVQNFVRHQQLLTAPVPSEPTVHEAELLAEVYALRRELAAMRASSAAQVTTAGFFGTKRRPCN